MIALPNQHHIQLLALVRNLIFVENIIVFPLSFADLQINRESCSSNHARRREQLQSAANLILLLLLPRSKRSLSNTCKMPIFPSFFFLFLRFTSTKLVNPCGGRINLVSG